MPDFSATAARFLVLDPAAARQGTALVLAAMRGSLTDDELRASLPPAPDEPVRLAEPSPASLVPLLAEAGIPPERAGAFVSLLLNYLRQELGSDVVQRILTEIPALSRFEARRLPGHEAP